MGTIELLSPVPSVVARATVPVRPLRTLRGKRVGFRVEWEPFIAFCDVLRERLDESGDIAGTVYLETSFQRAGEAVIEQRASELREFAAGIDVAVVGLAA